MKPSILEETYALLKESGGYDCSLKHVVLNLFFTVIETQEGGVGACMSYYKIEPLNLRLLQHKINEALSADISFGDLLFEKDGDWITRLSPPGQALALREGLRATFISALSANKLKYGGDSTFCVSRQIDDNIFESVDTALVIGFGGYMQVLCDHPRIKRVYVADLGYRNRRNEMDNFAANYNTKHVHIIAGKDTLAIARNADLVCITGSTLSNGTLEDLLDASAGAKVVVQGQSAGIHPRALFDRNVSLVTTTIKPDGFALLAKQDIYGKHIKEFLESGRDTIYLTRP
jgi:hypothetical protein